MAQYLNKLNKSLKMQAFCSVLILAVDSQAQPLSDPTRPPTSVGGAQDQSAGKGASSLELQSVLISPGRRVATINGQTVKLGEKIGESRVVKIAEDQVVIRSGQDIKVLKLFPAIEKRKESSRGAIKSEIR